MAPLLQGTIGLCLLLLTTFISAQDNPIPLVCQDGVQVIAAVGANIVNGSNSYGLTFSFVQKVMAEIPDSANISINYNRFHTPNITAQVFIPEVEEGVGALYAAISSYAIACPNTPIVLHGYSEGAVVVMNLLCGASSGKFPVTEPLDSSFASQIIAVVLYGDESRTANQSYNLGDCTASGPHLARRTPQGCAAFASSIQSYCFANDVDCCATANASAPYPYGIGPHFLYPAGYDNSAVAFVLNQHEKYLNDTLNSSSTTTTVSTASTSTSLPSIITSSSVPALSSSSSTSTSASTNIESLTSSSTFIPPSLTLTSSSTPTVPQSTTLTPTMQTSTSSSITTTSRGLPYRSTCTSDRCLSAFALHPRTASRFCGYLTSLGDEATPTTSPFPIICSGDYQSRVSSVCGCLIFPSSSASFSSVATFGALE